MKKFLPALLMVSALANAACNGGKIKPLGGGSGGGTGSGGGSGGKNGSDAGTIKPGAPSDGGGDSGPPANAVCAEDVKTAVQVPLAVMLVVDASSSMASSPGSGNGPSKYAQVQEALGQFVAAPGSEGLFVGLQFFPLPGRGSPCEKDAHCGYAFTSPQEPACEEALVCKGTVAMPGQPKTCGGPRNIACPAGDTCVPLGRCKLSYDDCTDVGMDCGGRAGDTCTAVGRVCGVTDEIQFCDAAAYETLTVPVLELPTAARVFARALGRRGPTGATPMRPAVEGAVAALRRHLMAHPDQRGILVLATDGEPATCTMNTVADVVTVLGNARTMSTIDTYVIGVATPDQGTERMALTQLATAGGTNMPFVITATEILSQRFLETLNEIRGKALPCEFNIPAASMGTMLDFGKVNLQIKDGATTEEVLYATSAARCDANRGGWYYDVDPATGMMPTRVIACPATCTKLRTKNTATVELRFGCKTRTID